MKSRGETTYRRRRRLLERLYMQGPVVIAQPPEYKDLVKGQVGTVIDIL
jgi:hypothetical protein